MANSITRKLLIEQVLKRGWSYTKLGSSAELLVVTNGKRTITFMGSRPTQSSANGRQITLSKPLTLAFVEAQGIRVPEYAVISSAQQLQEFLELHGTIVVKPADSEKSNGVTANITTYEEALAAYEAAREYGESVIAQRQIYGKLYRIFVLAGTVPVVTERRPAFVTGDGSKTTEDLIAALNQDPRRGSNADFPMKKIDLDKARQYLGDATFFSVPPAGESVRVTALESISEGGEAHNMTDSVHPEWITQAIAITKALGLFVAGFDVMTEDISAPPAPGYLPLLEINSMPGLRMHEYPAVGQAVPLASLLLDAVFE